MTTEAPIIRLDQVRKAYGPESPAVDGVDLAVRRGEILALLGPSGCGKTTTLRLIAGLEHPDAGSVWLEGRRVAGSGDWEPPERRRVGLVFQDYALFPHLTVAQNVGFGLADLPREERRARVAALLDLVELSGLGGRPPHELSGGQQQRVALARALAPGPAVILLDEPFSNLDAALRAQMRDGLRRIIRAARATAVFVTHDQAEALSLADRVAVMFAGRVAQLDTPQAVYGRPASRAVAEFVGEANWLRWGAAGHSAGATALARPEQLRVEAGPAAAAGWSLRPGAPPTVEGWAPADIVDITYYGHDQIVLLRLPDGTPLRARTGPRPDLWPGMAARVAVVGPVVVFAAA